MTATTMILDGHIHAWPGMAEPKGLVRRMREAGVGGGVVISPPPASFGGTPPAESPRKRLETVLAWTEGRDRLYPFFWIDPVEPGARRQVRLAVEHGAAGFKVICSRHYPGDRRAMRIYAAAAEAGRPILFHCGILYDGGRPSSQYNRPVGFEPLLRVPRLRFALAHLGWPWCDEVIAVYGKFAAARAGLTAELFLDLTPGTPRIYRREALARLLTVGYDVGRNIFFGTDANASRYNVRAAREWAARDRRIYAALGVGKAEQASIFAGNLRRFVTGESG